MLSKKEQRIRRARQTRIRIAAQGTARLTVNRTNMHIYAALISGCGSKVLALRCVEYAQRFNMPLHVRSSFSRRPGTLVVPDGIDPRTLPNLD